MAESCDQVKEKYDVCFNSWYTDYSTDKFYARKNLNKCNQFLAEYKSCVNKTLEEEFLKLTPSQKKTAFYY